MTRFSRDSKFRLRDFQRRGKSHYATCEVYKHQELEMEYIPIHPFSNEKDTLQRIGIEEKDCFSVDAYWDMKTDVSFMQVSTIDKLDCKIDLYARWIKEKKRYLNLVAKVNASSITRDIFEQVMSSFYKAGVLPSGKLRRTLTNYLVNVGKIS